MRACTSFYILPLPSPTDNHNTSLDKNLLSSATTGAPYFFSASFIILYCSPPLCTLLYVLTNERRRARLKMNPLQRIQAWLRIPKPRKFEKEREREGYRIFDFSSSPLLLKFFAHANLDPLARLHLSESRALFSFHHSQVFHRPNFLPSKKQHDTLSDSTNMCRGCVEDKPSSRRCTWGVCRSRSNEPEGRRTDVTRSLTKQLINSLPRHQLLPRWQGAPTPSRCSCTAKMAQQQQA